MEADNLTYLPIDSVKIYQEKKDSVLHSSLYNLKKDTSIYFSKEDLTISEINGSDSPSGHEGLKRPFTMEGEDCFFILLLVCFLLFTRIYKGGISFFKENSRSLVANRENFDSYKETTSTEFWFNFFLLFQTILLSAIVLFDFFLESNKYMVPKSSFYTILLFVIFISIFIAVKYVIYKFLGYLFNIQKYVALWSRTYIIVLEMMGIVAFLPALALVYSQFFHKEILFFLFIIFIICHLVLFYRLIVFFLREHINILFLITYLCSLEIIPYILLYQVLIYLFKVDIINLL